MSLQKMVNSVVVVLGAATTKEAKPTSTLLRRTRSGCELVQNKGNADLLLCGGQTNPHHFVKESEVMAAIAGGMGIAPERVVQEGQSRNTFENAIFTKRYIREKGWEKVIVVSDRLHLIRARMLFCALGIKADFVIARSQPDIGWRWVSGIIYEVPALLWYAIRILSGHHKPYLDKS